MLNILLSGTAGTATQTSSWWLYLVLIGLVIVMLVLPMFSQRKRNKEFNSMLDAMKVGDKIRTIGGVIGRITKINRDSDIPTVVIETGTKNEKTTMEFDVTAIQYNFNYNPQAAALAAETKKQEAKIAEKEAEKETPVEEPKAETEVVEEKKEETKAPAKKATAKKSSTTKKNPTKKTTAKKATAKKETK